MNDGNKPDGASRESTLAGADAKQSQDRQHQQQGVQFHPASTALSDPQALLKARQDASAAIARNASTSIVEYRSSGQCLIVANSAAVQDRDAALAAADNLAELTVFVLCPLDTATDATTDPAVSTEAIASTAGIDGIGKQITESGIKVFYRHLQSIDGHLGHFDVLVSDHHRADASTEHLGVTALTETGMFDLVLDFRKPGAGVNPAGNPVTKTVSAIDAILTPFGYFRVDDEKSLNAALAELPELVGEFEKPKFFDYDASICAHGRSLIPGCTNCVDVCSTQAIQSAGDGVSIDPYLCQGCGHCATVCPTGAMAYAYPNAADAIARSRELINKRRERPTVLLLHAVDDAVSPDNQTADAAVLEQFEKSLPAHVLPLAVEEVAAYGIDYWAAMVASGIKQVVVVNDPVGAANTADSETNTPVRDSGAAIQAVREQATLLSSILEGIGLAAERIKVIDSIADENFLPALEVPVSRLDWPPASFDTHNEKRQTLRMSIDYLCTHLSPAEPVIDLPQASPFGRIDIDADGCTLCMACVTTCPAGALLDGHSVPQLKFVEANCVQCGLCESACPENVLQRVPQYLYDSVNARKQRILNEEEPFHCVRCHKPFATRKLIENMAGKLAGHWMFENESAMRRLKMCEDCRVKDMFEESEGGIQVHKSEGRPES